MSISYIPTLWENVWQFFIIILNSDPAFLYAYLSLVPSLVLYKFFFYSNNKYLGSQMTLKRSNVESLLPASLPMITFLELIFSHFFLYFMVNQSCCL